MWRRQLSCFRDRGPRSGVPVVRINSDTGQGTQGFLGSSHLQPAFLFSAGSTSAKSSPRFGSSAVVMLDPDELESRWRRPPGPPTIVWYRNRVTDLIVEGRQGDVDALTAEWMLQRLG